MNEDPIKSNFSVDVDTEDLKNQTKDAANQVKETIKNVNLGQDAQLTKGFVIEAIKRPFTVINNIVSELEDHFSVAVILMLAMMALKLVAYILGIVFADSEYVKFHFVTAIKTVLAPLYYILAFTIATTVFGGSNKKKLTTMLTGFIVAYVPRMLPVITGVVYDVISISLVAWVNTICSNIGSFISIVLTFLVIKGTTTQSNNEDDNFKKIVIIACAAYIVLKGLAICGIAF